MEVYLNDPPTREKYKEFYVPNSEGMSELIADNRVPMSVAQLMQRRVEVIKGTDDALKSAWLDHFFDTGDAVVYHPDKRRLKIVLNSPILRKIKPQDHRDGGVLLRENGIYEALDGIEINRRKFAENGLSSSEAKSHPVWRVLARDQSLLNEYVNLFFSMRKKILKFQYIGMPVRTCSADYDYPEIWSVRIGDFNGNSNLTSALDLGLDATKRRFVGIYENKKRKESSFV